MTRAGSIRSIGLQTYLDRKDESLTQYQIFCQMMERGVSSHSMSKFFGVSDYVIYKWQSIYREEKK